MRLSTKDATDRERAQDAGDATDTSDESPEVQGRRSRAEDLQVARKRAQRRSPRIRERWSAADVPPLEGAGAPLSAWAADQFNPPLGPEMSPKEERGHEAQVRAAKSCELRTRGNFEVFTPVKTAVS